MAYSLMFPVHIFALPQGGAVVAGQAQIATPDARNMTVNQATPKAIINWQQFGIAQSEAVRFFQPGAASIALNRVVGVDPSIINGLLSANGRIFVINPNGLLVGPTGQINVNSFLA
ncbi:MAG: filamentous hemagglutinin N-terminal domain-containing protein, partial [Thermodesulfobacteriota bacterium]